MSGDLVDKLRERAKRAERERDEATRALVVACRGRDAACIELKRAERERDVSWLAKLLGYERGGAVDFGEVDLVDVRDMARDARAALVRGLACLGSDGERYEAMPLVRLASIAEARLVDLRDARAEVERLRDFAADVEERLDGYREDGEACGDAIDRLRHECDTLRAEVAPAERPIAVGERVRVTRCCAGACPLGPSKCVRCAEEVLRGE